MTLKQFFEKKYKIPPNLSVGDTIDTIINDIEKQWGIHADRNDLLIDVKQAKLINPITNEKEVDYFVVAKPSIELLKKFAVDYPHLVI